jgi:AbrB family looped-hinge helix DNA binding protein
MATHRARMSEGGRLVIPAEFRRQLGLQPGTEVILDVTDGELRIRSLDRAIARAQALVHRHVPKSTSLADELIRERHEAALLE